MPRFHVLARIGFRAFARNQGLRPWEIQGLMAKWSDDKLDQATELACQSTGLALPSEVSSAMQTDVDPQKFGAIADWIQRISEFFESPLGQAIMQILMMLLTMFLSPTPAATESVKLFGSSEPQSLQTMRAKAAAANVDWSTVKKWARLMLPVAKMFASRTENTIDDAGVAFLEMILAED